LVTVHGPLSAAAALAAKKDKEIRDYGWSRHRFMLPSWKLAGW